MARNRLIYLASLIGALVFHMYYTLWFSWFLLLFLAVFPLFSLILSLPVLLTARLHLDAPKVVILGEQACANLRLTASLPAGRCRVRLCAPIKRKTKLNLTQGTEISLPIPADHCLLWEVRLRKARIYDYLGLFSWPIPVPEAVQVEIRPLPIPPEPLPDVSRLQSPPLRPKAGGGFSEIHELRDYRPGDALRDVHWKLSAKTDTLVVREPQEEIRSNAMLTLHLDGPGSSSDSSLAQLQFLSPWLLERGIAHTVLCVCGPAETIQAAITSESDLDALLSRLIRRLPALSPWSSTQAPSPLCGGWIYSITPQKQEAAQ